MSFLYPGFLFALAAIAIPVIIHLFNFRKYRKVYFSNVRFLKEVQQETQSRNRLKQILILASRILAVICMVLAFAQPFIPGKNQDAQRKGDKATSVYVDNSFSMDARAKDGRLLELALRYAGQIGEVAGGSDRIQLLTGDFDGKHQVFYSPDEFENLLTEIQLSPAARPLSEIVKRQADLLNKTGAPVKNAFIISDFQKSVTDFQNLPIDSSVRFQLIPVAPSQASNLFIDSCWLTSPEVKPDAPLTMKVKIVNLSDQDYENMPLQLHLNGELKGPVNFSVAAGSTTETEVHFTLRETGFQQGMISLSDQEILFDDQFYFAFHVLEHINVLRIRGSNASGYVERLFSDDEYFVLSQMPAAQIDYSRFPSQQLIILDEVEEISTGLSLELNKFLEAGGSVFMIPAATGGLKGYREFCTAAGVNQYMSLDTADNKISPIRPDNVFFQDVFEAIPENMDMPVIKNHYPVTTETRTSSETILKLRNGHKFLGRDVSGKGYVYQLSVSLNEKFGNFPRHALFVPCLIKAAFSSQGIHSLYHTIGRNEFVQIPAQTEYKDKVFRLHKKDSEMEIIPEQRIINTAAYIYLGNELKDDGIYEITMDGEVNMLVAMNYDRKESVPDFYTTTQLQQMIEEYQLTNYSLINANTETFKKELKESEEGIRLWKLFIILALVFLGIEIVLIRFLK